jgi:succinate dehydrogenase/fumarate reductase flavoprotein subunit
MQKHVWLRRDEEGLATTLTELEKIQGESLPKLCVPGGRGIQRYLRLREALEAINLAECGQIVAAAALARKESRGSHQRVDYPNMDNRNWLRNIIIRQERGAMQVRAEPVVVTEVPLPKE